MNNNLNHIINKYFDWDYVFAAEASSKKELIQEKITLFESRYPHLPQLFIDLFAKNFPEWKLIDWSQLYLGDRCLRLLVEHSESKDRYIFLISIFELFAVYTMSLTKVGDKYVYGDLIFINKEDNTFCDSVYHTCMVEKFLWLDSETLNTVVEDLSAINQYITVQTSYAKLLFTFYYNI